MESVVLRLPFNDSIYPVIIAQGNHGSDSHFDLSEYGKRFDLTWAIDFKLPVGTPVLAGRSGIVVSIENKSEVCYFGNDPRVGLNTPVNFIAIKPDLGDGEIDAYVHLKYNSSRVVLEQNILEGEIIADTGLSGWIGEWPHLHIHVERNNPKNKMTETIPIIFEA